MTRPVLYLDFDGVLNDSAWFGSDVSEIEFPGHVVWPEDGVTTEQADAVVQILRFGAP